jgi:hypothetical protein
MDRRTLLFLIGSQVSLAARGSESSSMSARLRELALNTSAADLGLNASALASRPWGIVVDVARADAGVLTIACMADGSTSLYFSLGGGVIGAGRDPAVRAAGKLLLEEAAGHVPSMKAPSSTGTPELGSVAFFVLAAGGPYYASELERSLREGSGRVSSLYRQSQAVFRAAREAESSGRLK